MSRGDGGRLPSRVLQRQAMVGLVMAAACALIWGRYAGLSALAGAVIGLLANLYMRRKALVPERTPDAALRRLVVGQLVKVIVTIGLFMAVARLPRLVWPALLAAYLATLVVFWWVPLVAPARGESAGR